MNKNFQCSVIVVGASGFVGRHVSSKLETEFNVIKTSRRRLNGFVQFDMARDSISRLLSKIEDVKAGLSVVLCNKFGPMESYISDENLARECEVASVAKISRECKKMGIPIVYLSTSYVYPGERSGYNELSPVRPISLYGKLKREAELVLLESSSTNLILRLDKIVGTSFDDKHLFTEWYEAAKNIQKIRCIKGQYFSPTSVNDVALGIKLSLLNKLSGIYHCVNTEIWQRSNLARVFLEHLGMRAEITDESLEELGLKEERPIHSNLNSKKLVEAVGINFTSMTSIFVKMSKLMGGRLC